MTKQDAERLAHRHGMIRKRNRVTPYEAALCTLWLAGVEPDGLQPLAEKLLVWKAARKAEQKRAAAQTPKENLP